MKKPFALLAVLLAVLAVGCGGSDGSGNQPPAASPGSPAQTESAPATREDLDGRTFNATDAEGIRITKEAPLEITFDGPILGIDAGCNRVGGRYSLDEGVIRVFLGSTLMGCPPAQAELEAFVSELFRQEATARLSGDELTIEGSNGNSLSLED